MPGSDAQPNQGIALLLDCDDAMAEAVGNLGYRVERWTVSLFNEPPVDPTTVDLIVGDPRFCEGASEQYVLSGEELWQEYLADLQAARHNGEPACPCLEELAGACHAIARGAVAIEFVNESALPNQGNTWLVPWLPRFVRVERLGAPGVNPGWCSTPCPEIYGDFFESVREPVWVALPVEQRGGPPSWISQVNRRGGQVEPILLDPDARPLALVVREGEGATFILPGFADNAEAVRRLVTEIWPRVCPQTDDRETAGSREHLVDISGDFGFIRWRGSEYRFTARQADAVRELSNAGATGLHQTELAERLDLAPDTFRVQSFFIRYPAGHRMPHPAWGTLIVGVPDAPGRYRLHPDFVRDAQQQGLQVDPA